MAKKVRRKQPQSKKWSRSNVANYILGGLVALSMVLSSVLVFGGVTPRGAPPPAATPVIVSGTSTPTPVSVVTTPTPAK